MLLECLQCHRWHCVRYCPHPTLYMGTYMYHLCWNHGLPQVVTAGMPANLIQVHVWGPYSMLAVKIFNVNTVCDVLPLGNCLR